MFNRKLVVLDNGAYCAKVGYSIDKEPRVIPNCIIKAKTVRNRVFIGDQIDECKDLSGLYYLLAFQKGYLVNWELERQVWDHMFGKDGIQVNFDECGIIVTEPYFNFTSIQEALTEILFEDYQFQFVLRCNAGLLAQYKYNSERVANAGCCLVVDSGYSFTHIVPFCKGKKLKQAIRRINVGGKILTNHLKEITSYRQLMVMDETHVINQMKEDTCFASTDFYTDMKTSRMKGSDNTIVQEYVLPDYTHTKRGYVRSRDQSPLTNKDYEQVIRMNIERFAVPEVLFHPSDIGIEEMGIAEAVVHVIQLLPDEMQPHFFANIILTGGNCVFPGFKDRFYSEVRSLAPDEYDIVVTLPENPISYAWHGGAEVSRDSEFPELIVTRQEYDEQGVNICLEKFDV